MLGLSVNVYKLSDQMIAVQEGVFPSDDGAHATDYLHWEWELKVVLGVRFLVSDPDDVRA